MFVGLGGGGLEGLLDGVVMGPNRSQWMADLRVKLRARIVPRLAATIFVRPV